MCANRNLFNKLQRTSHDITVKIPDNRIQHVTEEGNIHINHDLFLSNVLYVPNFKFNLISVSKLTDATQSKFVFYSTYWLLHDQRTERILLKGKAIGSLYVLDSSHNVNFMREVLNCNMCKHLSCDIPKGERITCNKMNASIDTFNNVPDVEKYFTANSTDSINVTSTASAMDMSHLHTWHKRLGHAPINVLQHIKCLKNQSCLT